MSGSLEYPTQQTIKRAEIIREPGGSAPNPILTLFRFSYLQVIMSCGNQLLILIP